MVNAAIRGGIKIFSENFLEKVLTKKYDKYSILTENLNLRSRK
jgi:hypothetical protein